MPQVLTLASAWLAALSQALRLLTYPRTLRLCTSPEHPSAAVTYLLDHLADCLPKGLFQSTPYSCTLVLMSRASESACSMDGEGDTELDFEANIIDGSGSNSPPVRGSSGNPIKCNEPAGRNQPSRQRDWALVWINNLTAQHSVSNSLPDAQMMRVFSLRITSWCIANSTHPSPREKEEWRESDIRNTERQKELLRKKALSNNISQNTSASEPAWKVISLDIAALHAEIRARQMLYWQASLTHIPKILRLETGSSHLSWGKLGQSEGEPASSVRVPLSSGRARVPCCASLALPTWGEFTWLLGLDWAVSILLCLKGPLLIKVRAQNSACLHALLHLGEMQEQPLPCFLGTSSFLAPTPTHRNLSHSSGKSTFISCLVLPLQAF